MPQSTQWKIKGLKRRSNNIGKYGRNSERLTQLCKYILIVMNIFCNKNLEK